MSATGKKVNKRGDSQSGLLSKMKAILDKYSSEIQAGIQQHAKLVAGCELLNKANGLLKGVDYGREAREIMDNWPKILDTVQRKVNHQAKTLKELAKHGNGFIVEETDHVDPNAVFEDAKAYAVLFLKHFSLT